MSIHQLEPAILFDSNIYLIIGSEKVALIDTGTGFEVKKTISSLNDLLSGRKLDYVILTHRHFDHVGGLAAIIDEFHPEIYAGKEDAIPLRNGDSESTLGTKFGGSIRRTDVIDFSDGDELDIGGHVLHAIDTPGHTIGSISVLDTVTGDLFSGDTVFVDGVGNYSHPTGSGKMLIDSLIKLDKMDIRGLYPGHGPIVKDNGNYYIKKGLQIMGA